MDNNIYTYIHKHLTPTRKIEIISKISITESINLNSYYNYDVTSTLCRSGCKNYNLKWSCPPFSKHYIEISKMYEYCYVILMYTAMGAFSDIDNKFLRIKAGNSILKSKCEIVSRNIENKIYGYSLLSGSCRLCKPCNRKQDLPCKKPDLMRYSLEATGLDADAISKDLLNHELLWYSKSDNTPAYTSVICCVLSNEKIIDLDSIFKDI